MQRRLRQMVPTMRVGVHQRKDGDVQRIPELSHHQPAVDVWHTFPLIHAGRGRIPGKEFAFLINKTKQENAL